MRNLQKLIEKRLQKDKNFKELHDKIYIMSEADIDATSESKDIKKYLKKLKNNKIQFINQSAIIEHGIELSKKLESIQKKDELKVFKWKGTDKYIKVLRGSTSVEIKNGILLMVKNDKIVYFENEQFDINEFPNFIHNSSFIKSINTYLEYRELLRAYYQTLYPDLNNYADTGNLTTSSGFKIQISKI